MYNNPQGDGIYLVFKFRDDQLDTGSHTGTYRYKGPARVYNTVGKAKAQWTRFQREGYGSRVAEIRVDPDDGEIHGLWVDADWVLSPELCKYRSQVRTTCGHGWTYEICYRRKSHSGIHWSGVEAKKDPDYDPEVAMKETSND